MVTVVSEMAMTQIDRTDTVAPITTGSHAARRFSLASTVVMVAGAGLVAASATIHLHLWLAGYRHIHIIGPLFVSQAVTGYVIALAVAGTRRILPAAIGTLFLLGTIGGLLMSAWFGLFGFHDSFDAPYAGLSVVVEAVGAATLLIAGVLRFASSGHRPGLCSTAG